jgi:hypothetical protein
MSILQKKTHHFIVNNYDKLNDLVLTKKLILK